MAVVSSSLWYCTDFHVSVLELPHLVDGLVVGISFNLGERIDSEIGRDLVNCLWLDCHRGGSNPRDAAST